MFWNSGGAKGPGLFFILPCVDNHINVDLRTITFDVPPQEVLTKDSVTVTVDAVCYFRTYNPVLSGMFFCFIFLSQIMNYYVYPNFSSYKC